MTLDEAMIEINSIVRCIPWVPSLDPAHCPTGEPYKEWMWAIEHSYYHSTEAANAGACKMLASKVRYDRDRLLHWAKLIAEETGKPLTDKQPVLYWRVEPEYEIRELENGTYTFLYTRYAMVMDGLEGRFT